MGFLAHLAVGEMRYTVRGYMRRPLRLDRAAARFTGCFLDADFLPITDVHVDFFTDRVRVATFVVDFFRGVRLIGDVW